MKAEEDPNNLHRTPGSALSPRGVGLQTGRYGVGFFPRTTALPKQHKVVSTLGKVIRSTLSRTNHSAHQIRFRTGAV